MFGLWLTDDPYGRTKDGNFCYPITHKNLVEKEEVEEEEEEEVRSRP